MTYVLDTNSFRVLGNYYPARFPSFWDKFNELVLGGRVISVREARKELDYQVAKLYLREWIEDNRSIFLLPDPAETEFVREIFSNQHFQALVKKKDMLRKKPIADPFIIASAKVRDACVVTEEKCKPNAAKIPNVCEYYSIDCTNLEGLMEQEGWSF